MSLSDFIGTYSTPPEDRTDAFEAALVTRYCLPRAACSPVKPRVLEPRFADVYHYEPWSAALEGKTVLIIHPFEESIRSQYARRRQVWPDARMLPDFAELKVVKVPISAVGRHPHRDFLETLQVLQQAVEAAQLDVALMGCGGCGPPLAAYIRGNLSRSAIYVGGTQLFGIWGSRWVGRPDVKAIANEFWVHPSKSEVPSNEKLEGRRTFRIGNHTRPPSSSHLVVHSCQLAACDARRCESRVAHPRSAWRRSAKLDAHFSAIYGERWRCARRCSAHLSTSRC